MAGVVHVDAVPPAVDREEEDEAGLRIDAYVVEHSRERGSGPLRDEGPSFLAGLMRDLRARGESLELGERQGARAGHHAVDRQPPVRKAGIAQSFVIVRLRRLTVDG